MLDENLPTYRFKPSSENPFHTLLFFTHHGSDPSPEYLIKRPLPSTSRNQYAFGLLDAQYADVIYAEILLKPEWSQPTLSAAEIRANNGSAPQIANVPDSFSMSLYNPDQSVVVKQLPASWGKSAVWEFEMPERSFKLPSASQIDQASSSSGAADLVPKVLLRWKRDGRLSRDMTCVMCGRTVDGKKNKEPDITIAMFRGKNEATLTIYEPNMARVEVEDRKGLEMALLMSAEAIRDLYLSPGQDPFNTATSLATAANRRRTNSPPVAAMSGAIGHNRPVSPPNPQKSPTQANDARRQAEIDAETERVRAMVAEEERRNQERKREQERKNREREKADQEEQKRTQKSPDTEDKDRREREAEIDKETERLRREYGVEGQDFHSPTSPSPQLPPRPTLAIPGSWSSNGVPALPPRPLSAGPPSTGPPMPHFAPPPVQPQVVGGKKRHGLGGLLSGGPYGGPAGASVSGFFGGQGKKVHKKRSF